MKLIRKQKLIDIPLRETLYTSISKGFTSKFKEEYKSTYKTIYTLDKQS